MIETELLRECIAVILIVLVYLVKRSMEKGMDDVKTSLTAINSNITNIEINIRFPHKLGGGSTAFEEESIY